MGVGKGESTLSPTLWGGTLAVHLHSLPMRCGPPSGTRRRRCHVGSWLGGCISSQRGKEELYIGSRADVDEDL